MPGDGPFEIAACESDHIHVESSTISDPIQTNKQPNQGDLPQSAASVNTWAGRRAGERERDREGSGEGPSGRSSCGTRSRWLKPTDPDPLPLENPAN